VRRMDVRTKSPRVPRLAAWTAALVATTIAVLIAGGWWASQQGYVSWFGTACTAEGYDPVPSYDGLVTKYKKSPYCARLIRGETWFE
jgi:hypothetical protein